MIIFLTDGEATVGETNSKAILGNLRKANSDGVVSLFSLAFGSGADYKFLTQVSNENRGFSRKIYEAADATLQLKGFFDEVASPLLSNVHFVYKGNQAIEDITKSKVENYFKGSEFVVAGRLDSSTTPSVEQFTIAVNATSADGPYIIDYPLFSDTDDSVSPATTKSKKDKISSKSISSFSLEKIWAYLTIQDLLKDRERDDVTKEQQTNASDKALRLSLKYGFVTPLTSLIVVKPNETSTTDVRPANTEDSASDSLPQNYPVPFHSASYASTGGGSGFGYPAPVPSLAFQPVLSPHHVNKYVSYTTTPSWASYARPTFPLAIESEAAEVDSEIELSQESSTAAATEQEEEEGICTL